MTVEEAVHISMFSKNSNKTTTAPNNGAIIWLPLWNMAWLSTTLRTERPEWVVLGFAMFSILSLFPRWNRFLIWPALVFPLITILSRFPQVANHENIGVALILATCLGRLIGVRAESSLPSLCRYSLFFMYFWAFFHKLNQDFLNPQVSCANQFATDLAAQIPFMASLDLQSIYIPLFILAVEGLLALGILCLRFRTLCFFLAMSLHALLVPLGFINFGVWICFLFVAAFDLRARPLGQRNWQSFLFMIFTLLATLRGIRIDFSGLQELLNGLCILIILYTFYWLSKTSSRPQSNLLNHRILIGFWCGFLFFFGGMNYVGLRTAGNFSMFSNVATEGLRWNHLLVPAHFKIFHYQEDLHWFKSVPPEIQKLSPEQIRPGWGTADVVIARLKTRGWTAAEPRASYSWLELSLLHFRPVQPGQGPQTCRW